MIHIRIDLRFQVVGHQADARQACLFHRAQGHIEGIALAGGQQRFGDPVGERALTLSPSSS
jgi:hypothetical protein